MLQSWKEFWILPTCDVNVLLFNSKWTDRVDHWQVKWQNSQKLGLPLYSGPQTSLLSLKDDVFDGSHGTTCDVVVQRFHRTNACYQSKQKISSAPSGSVYSRRRPDANGTLSGWFEKKCACVLCFHCLLYASTVLKYLHVALSCFFCLADMTPKPKAQPVCAVCYSNIIS